LQFHIKEDKVTCRESRHINGVPSDDAIEPEVVEAESESEQEIIDEPEPKIVDEPQVGPDSEVDELDPDPEVKESLIETAVDLLAEPIRKLLLFSPAMRVPLSLRPLDCTTCCGSFYMRHVHRSLASLYAIQFSAKLIELF